jgi:hypothetical protein
MEKVNDVKKKKRKEETVSPKCFPTFTGLPIQAPTISLAERPLNANLGQIILGLLSSSPLCHTFLFSGLFYHPWGYSRHLIQQSFTDVWKAVQGSFGHRTRR